jgi:hypothetical protein
MMARKDSVSKRLSAAFKFMGPVANSRAGSITQYDEDGNPVGEPEKIEWKDIPDSFKTTVFGSILTIPLSAPMGAAFKVARLDPTDPLHWYQLLFLFSWAYFSGHRRRGAPTKWEAPRLCKLINDFEAKKLKNPGLSDEDVFKYLGKTSDYRTKKGPLSPSRIRKLLKEARDPKRNDLLQLMQLRDGLKPPEENVGAASEAGTTPNDVVGAEIGEN